jgi:FdrA protein
MTGPVESVVVRQGVYADSVALMEVSRAVGDTPGVVAALVSMATELNLEVLADLGFAAPPEAGSGDLVVAVRAGDEAAVAQAMATAERLLSAAGRGIGEGGDVAPARTTRAAAARAGATLALISVPGPHAFVEAMDALAAGLHVMIFSDNVPLGQEVRLKDEGARRGLLVMGPDCGTALVNGVGLGFANSVRPGPVGLVAASGTGAQQLMCLMDSAGVGVSACLGVGGRDLSSEVGGRATRQALSMLDADPATEHIVLVSKPPAADVVESVLVFASELATPTQLVLLGQASTDLTAAAAEAVRAVGGTWTSPMSWPPADDGGIAGGTAAAGGGALRGLFAGGTLCDEAMLIASEALGPVRSNIPLLPAWALPGDLRADGHVCIDFGDDRLTAGRPHPMIDFRSRLQRLALEASDPAVGVVLLDVVLGYGAHPDPAAELAPAVAAARRGAAQAGRRLEVVASLCGTETDPQDLAAQAHALRGAGAHVHLSNAAATRLAVDLVRR